MKKQRKPEIATTKVPRRGLTARLFGLLRSASSRSVPSLLSMRTSRSPSETTTPVSETAACEACPLVGSITFAPTVSNSLTAPGSSPVGMVWIPGGEFSMGSTVESELLCGLPGVTRDVRQ